MVSAGLTVHAQVSCFIFILNVRMPVLRQVSKAAEPAESPLTEQKCLTALLPFSSPLQKAFPKVCWNEKSFAVGSFL